MARSIRLRFALLTIICLFVISSVTIASINAINYYKVNKYVDSIISILSQSSVQSAGDIKSKLLADPLLFPSMPDTLDPDTTYDANYFTVSFQKDSSSVTTNTSKDPLITQDEAKKYGKMAKGEKDSRGYIKLYRYNKMETKNGSKYVFLDCSTILANFKSFLYTSIEVALGCLVLASILILIHGQIIFKPVIESYEKQKRFITNASHEMKTPIAIISADVEALLYEIDDNQWTQDIITQVKRLSKLISELVFLSKMEEHFDRRKYYKTINLSEITEEIAISFEGRAKATNAGYTYYIDPKLTLFGNEEEIQTLISSILDNAFNNNSDEGNVNLFLIGRGKGIRFVVYNNTDNVSDEELPHLFERFYRTDSSRGKESSGFGIGLSIAKAIVEAHKGTITAVRPDSNSFAILVDFY